MRAVVDVVAGYGLAAFVAACTVLLMGLWQGDYLRARTRLSRTDRELININEENRS